MPDTSLGRIHLGTAGLLVGAAVMGIVHLGGAECREEPKSLVVQRLSIVDARGRPRISLAVDACGDVAVLMMQEDGKQRLSMTVRADGWAGVTEYSADGLQRLSIGTTSGGVPGVRLRSGPLGNGGTTLFASEDEEGLSIHDRAGVERLRVSVDEASGLPQVLYKDVDGNVVRAIR